MSPKGSKAGRVGCDTPTDHDGHLCRMMEMGQTAAIREVAGHAYVCANCGAHAATAEALCNPLPSKKT